MPKTQMQRAIEKMIREQEHEEEQARAQTRLVSRMSHDSDLSALERGYMNEEEVKTERDRAFERSQSFRNNPNRY